MSKRAESLVEAHLSGQSAEELVEGISGYELNYTLSDLLGSASGLVNRCRTMSKQFDATSDSAKKTLPDGFKKRMKALQSVLEKAEEQIVSLTQSVNKKREQNSPTQNA